jgi:hypothetical protein
MARESRDVLLRLPPRALAPHERALFAEWLALAGDVGTAYISERRSDDPALYRRLVIASDQGDKPTHLIHAPEGLRVWVLMKLGPYPEITMYDSLRTALNSIRPVLDES